MPEFFKHSLIDSDHYPMPSEPSPLPPMSSTMGMHGMSQSDVGSTEVQAAASDVRQLLDLLGSLTPAMRELAEQAQIGGREHGYREGVEHAQMQMQQQLIEAA